jgi:GDPmannose 4,6-dehydratase
VLAAVALLAWRAFTALVLSHQLRYTPGLATPVKATLNHLRRNKDMPPTALITGITGQDGTYLAEWLLEKGYEVHGADIQTGRQSLRNLQHLIDRLTVHHADLTDQSSLEHLIEMVRPTELYNLAAQSSVALSWERPVETGNVTGLGVARLLDTVRRVDPSIRFFQASSSEVFGQSSETPQSETTRMEPGNPYGVAKLYAQWMARSYRESHGLFTCCGILFNHESPRRATHFVTRKITHGVARIKHGLASELSLGNLQSRRDWGFAGDFVRAMWLMLQQDEPDDYVIGTGETHSVEEFVAAAFSHADLDWRRYVIVDPKFYRPADEHLMIADPSKARNQLGWQPRVSFQQLVCKMVDADMALLRDELSGDAVAAPPSEQTLDNTRRNAA